LIEAIRMLARSARRTPSILQRCPSSLQRVNFGIYTNEDRDDQKGYHNTYHKPGTNPFDKAKIIKGATENKLMRFREYRFNWDFQGHNSHEMAMQEFYQEADPEDPFDEHPLPFYMEYQFHDMESYETQLRTGMWWNPKDRIAKYRDLHAWEMSVDHADGFFKDNHHWRSPDAFLPYPDILWPWVDKYEYELKQLENHVSMIAYLPYARHLVPQLARELWDIGRTRATTLKERFGVSGVDYLAPQDDQKKQRTAKSMYKDPGTGPLVTPWFGEAQTNIERMPLEQGRAIESWRKTNPEREPMGPETEKAKLAQWILEFETKSDELFIEKEVNKHKWVKVFFIDAMGDKHRVYGMVGETLLETSRRWEIPIDGHCLGGDRAELYSDGPRCHWCQIDIAPRWIHTLPPMDWKEEHHTNYYRILTPTSRLSCQIVVTEQMDGFTCSIPQMSPSIGLSMEDMKY